MTDLICFISGVAALSAATISGLWRYVRWLQGRVLEAESAVAHLRARLDAAASANEDQHREIVRLQALCNRSKESEANS